MLQRVRLPIPFSLRYLAQLVGLEWSGTLSTRWAEESPLILRDVDPFLESLGSFDAHTRTMILYQQRCFHCAGYLGVDRMAVIRTVITHFCAHAVTLLGVHPVTGKKYINAGDPAKMFKNSPAHHGVTHGHYDELRREEELFAQIVTYLWTFWNADAAELKLFRLLSQGHAGLYSLGPSGFLPRALRQDWKALIEADQTKAANEAARVLGLLTRGVPIQRDDLLGELDE